MSKPNLDPVWLTKARSYLGLKEIPGPQHNAKIIGWLRDLKAWWSDDETPWCGTFVAHCLQTSHHPIPTHWYRAKAWAEYGSRLQTDRLAAGAILVFDREGGGHVGFYIGESTDSYFVLGGNQSNGVNVTRILKSRLLASRWPTGAVVLGKPVPMSFSGTPISENEA